MADATDSGRTLAKRAGLVTAGTLGSRVLGMLRDVAIAGSFPVLATDAFFIAFTIPNSLRMLLGEGAVQNAFVPVFADVKSRGGSARARRFLSRFAGTLAILLLAATLLGMLAAPLLGGLYGAGYHDDPQQLARVTTLTRWLFPFLWAAGLSALAAGALNSVGRFGVPALTPALINVAMIAAALWLTGPLQALSLDSIHALVVGALVGGLLQLGANVWALRRADLLPAPTYAPRDADVRLALRLMLPLLAGLGVYQLNILLSRMLASFLPAGSQSYLSYGQRVVEIPQGMFALAVASAALPTLSALRAAGKRDELLGLFRVSLRMTAFVAIPSSVALFVLAEPTIATLFGRGAFGAAQVHETAQSLAYQALGVCAFAGVRTVVPMFAAHHETRAPVVCSALNVAAFLGLALSLMGPMLHVGLAVANSAAGYVQLAALLLWLRRLTGPMGLRSVATSALRTLLASGVMAAVVVGLDRVLQVTLVQGELRRILAYLGLVGAGAGAFVVAAALLRSPELTQLKDSLRRRRRPGTATPPS